MNFWLRELSDPMDQRNLLTERFPLAALDEDEAMKFEEDFLQALERKKAPTGCSGICVDRVVMLFTGRSTREIRTFPWAKPRL